MYICVVKKQQQNFLKMATKSCIEKLKVAKFKDERYYLTVDLDERGEYSATLYNYSDDVVWECDTEFVAELIEDGFLRRKPNQDLNGLAKYLASHYIIPSGSTIDDGPDDEYVD